MAALSPDYAGNLLLNITTGDGTVLKTLTLIYDGNTGGTTEGVTHWETAGDDLGTCYCGTGCCNAVYLQYRYYNNTWFTECYVEDEGGCWDWTGTELALGKNLVTSIETGKPLSVVITKVGEEPEPEPEEPEEPAKSGAAVSRIFELYRRMGNGNLGTPVPVFLFEIIEITASGSGNASPISHGAIPTVAVKVQNIGNASGTFRTAATGYYIDTTDLGNDEEGTKVNIEFPHTVDTYLEKGGTAYAVVGGKEIGGLDRKGTLHVDVVLTGLSFPYHEATASADGSWQGKIGTGTGTSTTE